MIYGKRVRLRGMERTDVPKSFEWINDPEVTEGLAIYLPMSINDEEQWFERMSQRDQEEKPMAIEMREGVFRFTSPEFQTAREGLKTKGE